MSHAGTRSRSRTEAGARNKRTPQHRPYHHALLLNPNPLSLPQLDGHITRQSTSWRKHWKSSYFVLQSGFLTLYATHTSTRSFDHGFDLAVGDWEVRAWKEPGHEGFLLGSRRGVLKVRTDGKDVPERLGRLLQHTVHVLREAKAAKAKQRGQATPQEASELGGFVSPRPSIASMPAFDVGIHSPRPSTGGSDLDHDHDHDLSRQGSMRPEPFVVVDNFFAHTDPAPPPRPEGGEGEGEGEGEDEEGEEDGGGLGPDVEAGEGARLSIADALQHHLPAKQVEPPPSATPQPWLRLHAALTHVSLPTNRFTADLALCLSWTVPPLPPSSSSSSAPSSLPSSPQSSLESFASLHNASSEALSPRLDALGGAHALALSLLVGLRRTWAEVLKAGPAGYFADPSSRPLDVLPSPVKPTAPPSSQSPALRWWHYCTPRDCQGRLGVDVLMFACTSAIVTLSTVHRVPSAKIGEVLLALLRHFVDHSPAMRALCDSSLDLHAFVEQIGRLSNGFTDVLRLWQQRREGKAGLSVQLVRNALEHHTAQWPYLHFFPDTHAVEFGWGAHGTQPVTCVLQCRPSLAAFPFDRHILPIIPVSSLLPPNADNDNQAAGPCSAAEFTFELPPSLRLSLDRGLDVPHHCPQLHYPAVPLQRALLPASAPLLLGCSLVMLALAPLLLPPAMAGVRVLCALVLVVGAAVSAVTWRGDSNFGVVTTGDRYIAACCLALVAVVIECILVSLVGESTAVALDWAFVLLVGCFWVLPHLVLVGLRLSPVRHSWQEVHGAEVAPLL